MSTRAFMIHLSVAGEVNPDSNIWAVLTAAVHPYPSVGENRATAGSSESRHSAGACSLVRVQIPLNADNPVGRVVGVRHGNDGPLEDQRRYQDRKSVV